MTKEKLEERLIELNKALEENMKSHNEMVSQRDNAINEGMARHNMLIGQRNEVAEWIAKLNQSEEFHPEND